VKQSGKSVLCLIDAGRKSGMFFISNSLMPKLTEQYLTVVKEKYFLPEQYRRE
jgi:hypothetical protein